MQQGTARNGVKERNGRAMPHSPPMCEEEQNQRKKERKKEAASWHHHTRPIDRSIDPSFHSCESAEKRRKEEVSREKFFVLCFACVIVPHQFFATSTLTCMSPPLSLPFSCRRPDATCMPSSISLDCDGILQLLRYLLPVVTRLRLPPFLPFPPCLCFLNCLNDAFIVCKSRR